jgi:pyruvate ferredoxin oxidoreductase beta subunit
MVRIMAAHGIPYAASASLAYPLDYLRKVKKAIEIDGPTYIHLQSPCLTGWGIPESQGVAVARLAVQTCVFPVYEVYDGNVFKITVKPREKKPIEEYLKVQGRFRHLFTDGWPEEIAKFQAEVDENWRVLNALEQMANGGENA